MNRCLSLGFDQSFPIFTLVSMALTGCTKTDGWAKTVCAHGAEFNVRMVQLLN
jgi:hypothetical protein